MNNITRADRDKAVDILESLKDRFEDIIQTDEAMGEPDAVEAAEDNHEIVWALYLANLVLREYKTIEDIAEEKKKAWEAYDKIDFGLD